MTQAKARRPALRPEARAVDRDKLDPRQQVAFDQIMRLLDEAAIAVRDLEPPKAKPPRPYLEAERSSRTALIYGRRGTGKTTLLLSLLRALAEPTKDLPVGRNLVLLNTLDMEPLAESTNLIGAVLARLEEAAGSPAEAAERSGGWSRAGRVSGEEAIMMKLADLQTRAASAFGSNLRDRAGGLDPDNFAAEVRRAERHRMDFGQQFAHGVAEVAQHLKKTRADLGQAPLFVLPVDDLDLNPTACVPLLEGLRAVHSPHLFVLLLADLKLIETVLRLQYQARFIRTGRSKVLDSETQGHVLDLATNAVRKHLPPSQRMHLARVSPEQAVAFPLLGEEKVANVYEIFGDARLAVDKVWPPGRFDLAAEAPPLTVREAKRRWLPNRTEGETSDAVDSPAARSAPASDPSSDVTPTSASPSGWPYSWVRVFRMTFRELVDAVLDAETGRGDLARLARERVEAIAAAAVSGAEVHPTESSRYKLTANVLWPPPEDLQEPEDYRVQTVGLAGWSAEWGGVSLDRADQRQLAGILDIEGADADLPFPVIILRTCPPLRRTLPPGDGQPPEDWPMPQHSTCWGYEDAARLFAAVDHSWRLDPQPDPLFGAWVDAMTQVIEQALPGAVTTPTRSDWSFVCSRLQRLSRGPLGRAWRAQVLALCTPEMGMLDPELIQTIEPSAEERAEAQRLRGARTENRSQRFRELAERPLWWS